MIGDLHLVVFVLNDCPVGFAKTFLILLTRKEKLQKLNTWSSQENRKWNALQPCFHCWINLSQTAGDGQLIRFVKLLIYVFYLSSIIMDKDRA